MHTCFTLKKRKKILILNSSKLNLQLYPSPEKKRKVKDGEGGGDSQPLEPVPPAQAPHYTMF